VILYYPRMKKKTKLTNGKQDAVTLELEVLMCYCSARWPQTATLCCISQRAGGMLNIFAIKKRKAKR
jgi:hypothetical protein